MNSHDFLMVAILALSWLWGFQEGMKAERKDNEERKNKTTRNASPVESD